ncbi:MAG: hypothetical protein WCQ16_09685 [Verrucomicrobiae bacterium]
MATLMADASEILKFETALLLLVTAGLLVLAKMFSDLRAEVRSLREARGGSAPASAAGSPPPFAPPQDDDIAPDVFVAIVSAVHFALGENHRIVSVNPAESLAWSREGRRSIFRSHTFR